MKRDIWQKRIPTLLGLALIIVGIGATSFLTKNGVIFSGKAAPPENPEAVRITNISDTSFTVSYTTKASVVGSISLGKDENLGKTYLDDRDQQTGKTANYKVHHITIRDLTPNTKYYFIIISGQVTFLNQANEDSPFEATTGPVIQNEPDQQQPMFGKILLSNGNKPDETIIYITTPNAQTISTLLKNDGSYILPLNSIRSQYLESYFKFNNNILQMLAIGNSTKSQVALFVNQINPVPTIILSKDYDFTINSSPVATSSAEEATRSAESIGFPSFSANPSQNKEPKILTPKKDEGFSDGQPLFKGVALPESEIKVIIHSEEKIQTEIKADKNGNWNYRPQQKLSPGQHTIAISTKDKFGIIKTITQSFMVYAEGSQVTGSATPSATPRLTSPTPTTTLAPTLTPTLSLSPTSVIIPTPTLIPTIAAPTVIPTKQPMPIVGSSDAKMLGILATTITVIGLFIFFLSRGSISL